VAIVYIAGRLSESKQVEQVLTENAIDYAVDIESLEKRLLGILPVKYKGIGFYVFSGQADFCRRVLHGAGMVQGLVEDDLE
jgi:predicted nucleic acid-binding Zn ribbon protein